MSEKKRPSYYGTFDEHYYIIQLVTILDGEITYGELWDSKPENKEAFDQAKQILEEYKYGVLNGLIGSAR